MRTLYAMLLKLFFPIFLISLMLFILVFQLVDLFANIWRFIENDISLADIGYMVLLYLPKCVTYSMPIALLFAISFALGLLYTNNEMLLIFISGINLYKFIFPFLVLGLAVSLGMFFFEEKLVIWTFKEKDEYQRRLFHITENFSRDNVAVISVDRTIIYHANSYNDRNDLLSGVTIIERKDGATFTRRIDAASAQWNGQFWDLKDCRIFNYNGDEITEEYKPLYSSDKYNEKPVIFRSITNKVAEMDFMAAKAYIDSLRRAGLPYQENLSEYYKKFAFALTSLIVVLISSSMGSMFRKNVVLMSLLCSLGIVIVYYVFQLVTITCAKFGYISPLIGAWSPTLTFSFIGIILFKYAHT